MFNFYSRGTVPINFYSRNTVTLTVLELPFTGTQGDTTTDDVSGFNNILTANGTVFIDTAGGFISSPTTSYFGSDGGDSTGGGKNYWEVAGSTVFNFVTNAFGFSFYAKWEREHVGFDEFLTWEQGPTNFVQFYFLKGTGTAGVLRFVYRSDINPTTQIQASVTWHPNPNDWYYIELTKVLNEYSFLVTDVTLGSPVLFSVVTNSGNVSGASTAVGCKIGTNSPGSPNRQFQGWMDDLTIITTVSRDINFYG